MVQLPNFDKHRPVTKQIFTTAEAAAPVAPVAVKAEVEDPLDEMFGPFHKRSKLAEPSKQPESKMAMPSGLLYDPLDEPSPLGLRLKKSPSFLDMIQMKLSQEKSVSTSSVAGIGLDNCKRKELKSTAVSSTIDKMKASNFPASVLRIGNWEYVSRYEGDLVAKCYYAKHKLVWEVLDGGLKNKIEIQWSDITALKATFPENGSDTLDIVLARRPLFFRETNPQPRKHTLWQATSDFTGGQASSHRRHFLQCHQGLLAKHFEKLIQCDPRLKSLSQQSEIILESSSFEPSSLEDPDESNRLRFDSLKENHGSSAGFHEPYANTDATNTVDAVLDHSSRQMHLHDSGVMIRSSAGFHEPYANTDATNTVDAVLDHSSRQMHLHDSGVSSMRARVSEENVHHEHGLVSNTSIMHNSPMQTEQHKVLKLRASMSKDDLVSHLEHCISERVASGNPLFSADCLPNKKRIEEMAEYLLTDSQTYVSDEKSIMSKVNSLCCLLQKDDPSFDNLQFAINASTEGPQGFVGDDHKLLSKRKDLEEQQPLGISRKDSFGELLSSLPRIASIPQFLFSITEDNDDQSF